MRWRAPVAILVAVALTASCSGGGGEDDDGGGGGTAEAGAGFTCPDHLILGCPRRVATASIPVAGTHLELTYASDHVPGGPDSASWDARPLGLGGWMVAGLDFLIVDDGILVTGTGPARDVEPIEGRSGELLVPSVDGRTVGVFEPDGHHLRTVDALTGATIRQYTYDAEGRLVTVADGHGTSSTIERGADGAPTAIVGAGGIRTGVGVDRDGYLLGTSDAVASGRSLTYAEDGDGLLAAISDALGRARAFEYDESGRLTAETDADGVRVELAGSGDAVTITDADGSTTWRSEGDGADRTVTVADPAGSRTEEALTAARHLLTLADGTTVETGYEDDPRWGGAVPTAVRRTVTTPGGRATELQIAIETDVDPADLLVLRAATVTTTIDGAATTSRWDGAARSLTTTHADSSTAAVRVDERGDVIESTQPGRGAVRTQRDGRGRPVRIEDARGVTTIDYPEGIPEVVVTDALGQVHRLGYDEYGRLAAVSDPSGRRTTLERDVTGLPVAVRVDGVQVQGVSWTGAGRPAGRTGASDDVLRYDEGGRLAGAGQLAGAADDEVGFSYADDGGLASVTLAAGELAYSRDPVGQLVRAEADEAALEVDRDGPLVESYVADGAVGGSVGFVFDEGTAAVEELDLAGASFAVEHDAARRVSVLGPLTLERPAGDPRVGTTTAGSIGSTRTYDPAGDLASEAWTQAGAPLFGLAIQRDVTGRVTTEVQGTAAGAVTRTVEYDAAGRLAAVRGDDGRSWTYAYDTRDDVVSATGPDGITEERRYDEHDRLLSLGAATYQWGDDGALVSWTGPGGTTELTHDELGRLTGASLPSGAEITYVLDALGRRTAREVDGDLVEGYLYDDGSTPVARIGADGEVDQRYLRVGAGAPAVISTADATYRVVADRAGSPRLVVDTDTGEVVQELEYDPYGRVVRDTNPGFQPFGFGGGLLDPGTGLVRLGAREYDPAAGRFTTVDPSPLGGGQVNPYAFAGSDPVNRVDPTGLSATAIAQAAPAQPNQAVGDYADALSILGGMNDLLGGLAGIFGPAQLVGSEKLGLVGELSGAFRALGWVGVGLGLISIQVGIARYQSGQGTPEQRRDLLASIIVDTLNTAASTFMLVGLPELALIAIVLALIVFLYQLNERRHGRMDGDPHLGTHDGRAYDFQAAGEFVAVHADDGTFDLQARLQPLYGTRTVTFVTAIAVTLGTDRVQAEAGETILVDGLSTPLAFGTLALPGGGRLTRLFDGQLVLDHPDGATQIVVVDHRDQLDVSLAVAPTHSGRLSGLLGDFDGDPADDLALPDGSPFPLEDGASRSALASDPLYATYGEAWRVSPASSLFTYAAGASPETYIDRTVPEAPPDLGSLPPNDREQAEAICRGAGIVLQPHLDDCTLDVALTGDAGLASSSAIGQTSEAVSRTTAATGGADGGGTIAAATEIELGDRLAGELGDGDADRYVFTDEVGGSVVVVPEPGQSCLVAVRFLDEDGDVLGQTGACEGGVVELPEERRWTIVVSSVGDGSYAFTIDRVGEATSRDVSVGDEVSGQLQTPGERHEYTLDVDAGDVVFIAKIGDVSCDVHYDVVAPDGTVVRNGGGCADLGRVDFAVDGEHRVVVTAPAEFTGPYGFEILESRPDRREHLAVGGEASGVIDAPGARDIWEVDAAAGQVLTIRGGPHPCVLWLRPFDTAGGSLQGLLAPCGDSTFTAPPDGHLEIWVFSLDRNTDDYTFRLEGA